MVQNLLWVHILEGICWLCRRSGDRSFQQRRHRQQHTLSSAFSLYLDKTLEFEITVDYNGISNLLNCSSLLTTKRWRTQFLRSIFNPNQLFIGPPHRKNPNMESSIFRTGLVHVTTHSKLVVHPRPRGCYTRLMASIKKHQP